ncbi:MAG: hypothetical protein ACRCZS_20925 [Chroococcidiopsis sp.]
MKKTKQNKQTLVKNLNQLVTTLPSNYLKESTKNVVQLVYWHFLQEDAKLLGECLSARFTRRGGNPARRYWQEGKITESQYEQINAQVDAWDLFYDLLQLAWDDMKRINLVAPQKFPFEQEQDLFFTVLTDHYNADFCECLQQYCKYSTANVEKAGKMIRSAFWKNKTFTPEQQQKFDKLVGNESENPWFIYATQFFIDLAKDDSVVAKKLEEYKKSLINSADLSVQSATRTRKSGNSLTYAWHDNQLSIIKSGSKTVTAYNLLTNS